MVRSQQVLMPIGIKWESRRLAALQLALRLLARPSTSRRAVQGRCVVTDDEIHWSADDNHSPSIDVTDPILGRAVSCDVLLRTSVAAPAVPTK